MKYYFKLLNWKLNANKNTFKEAEILEQEWGYSYDIGRRLDGGDIEVAEQFRYFFLLPLLTNRTNHPEVL
jgi:mitogen-activated protein kinase kinase kinase